MATCKTCSGEGSVQSPNCNGEGMEKVGIMVAEWVECRLCHGSGVKQCGVCNGSGTV